MAWVQRGVVCGHAGTVVLVLSTGRLCWVRDSVTGCRERARARRRLVGTDPLKGGERFSEPRPKSREDPHGPWVASQARVGSVPVRPPGLHRGHPLLRARGCGASVQDCPRTRWLGGPGAMPGGAGPKRVERRHYAFIRGAAGPAALANHWEGAAVQCRFAQSLVVVGFCASRGCLAGGFNMPGDINKTGPGGGGWCFFFFLRNLLSAFWFD